MDRNLIEDLISKHEATRNTVYRDTEGNLTVGKGFNLDRPGAQETCDGCGIDYEAVCNGSMALTDAQVAALFDGDVNAAIFAAGCQVHNFDELPDAVQAVVVDMMFNLGSRRFSEFVKFKAALAANPPDFEAAANEIRNSAYCGQVKTRCAENAELVEQAG